jgi:hypothetical protein
MLSLSTPTGHTYPVALRPLASMEMLPVDEHHAYVIALTNGRGEKSALLRIATVAEGDSIGHCLVAWQRMGATHYGVVAERHPEREAEALAAELAQTFGVPGS